MRENFELKDYYDLYETESYKTDAKREELALMTLDLVGWRDHVAEFADYRACLLYTSPSPRD